MGDFKKNPKKPFEIRVPNKIRKRIAMHEKSSPEFDIIKPLAMGVQKCGSIWTRFIESLKKLLK